MKGFGRRMVEGLEDWADGWMVMDSQMDLWVDGWVMDG